VTKAIVLLGPDGVAIAPPILCADNPAEARQRCIPLFDQIFAQLSAGMQMRSNGNSTYEIYKKDHRVGSLEVLESPLCGEDHVDF
jgi:hypothetical protein